MAEKIASIIVILAALWLLSFVHNVYGAETYGPYQADVIRVYDGDTFTALVWTWPREPKYTTVRINGLDTPELRTLSKCEKEMALIARDYLRQMIGGQTVTLRNIRAGKYYGRVIADVSFAGDSVMQHMVDAGLGRVYGGGKRGPWCEDTP